MLEVEGSGCNLGYRSMWKKIQKVYNITATRETVRKILGVVDPEGVEARRRYKLKRRTYNSPGPNFIWHADNYDKLKRFGFPIYGCIDGYSRKVIWLEVSKSNNDPKVIGSYYLKTIKKLGFVPTLMRTDNGTEANLMENLQMALRYYHNDEHSGTNSFIRGKSTRNQRIEAFWRQFRQRLIEFYINLFKTMEEKNILNVGCPIQVDCLRYCFERVIKEDTKSTREELNEHRVRKQNSRNVCGGIPNVLYNCPEKFGVDDFKKDVDLKFVDYLEKTYTTEPTLVSSTFKNLAVELLNTTSRPTTVDDSLKQYLTLTEALIKLESSINVI